jgi:maleamate amidohydrolase
LSSAEDLYRERGFGGAQGLGERPALVVVDFCYGFTDPASALACDCDDALAVTARLLAAFRAAQLPVVFTTVVYDDTSAAIARAFIAKAPALSSMQRGSRWPEIDARIAPAAGEPVLEKLFASGFFGTNLASLLAAQRCDSAVVVGASTSGCVRATAIDALQHGYRVTVVADGVADRSPAAHRASLTDLEAKYTDVLDAADVIDRIAAR